MKKRLISTLIPLLLLPGLSQASWLGWIGHETAQTVQPTTKSEVQQLETALMGSGIDRAGLKLDNVSVAKWNEKSEITVFRNWAYGYWNDNHGLSLDWIKADWQGPGSNILAAGYAYKNCWNSFCLRANPTLAYMARESATGSFSNNYGVQFNLKMDYQLNDRFALTFHPQYVQWDDANIGSTLKLEFDAHLNLTADKRHKLMLVNEYFMQNNRATGERDRFVGENSPLGGYVAGTESTFKLRYLYVF